MNIGLLIAAILCLFTWGVHIFLGGPDVAKPLLESQMEEGAKYTNYYCWHIVTLVLFVMAVGYGYAAFYEGGLDVAILCTALSIGFTLWSWVLILWSKRTALELPQWTLFLVIAGVASWGIWAG